MRLAAKPFEPFFIRLADGRQLNVTHLQMVWLPAPGMLWVYRSDARAGERITPLLIVSVESPGELAQR